LYLWDGISVVPVVVGLFGGAEVLQLMMAKGSIARTAVDDRLAGIGQGVRDTLSHWSLTLRASAIGVGIGVIPGMGGAVSQFIAYAHAQQTSTHPETFGHGNVEGVLAAGAVNNSREGGNLIPTVAFGMPGSVAMAILLSVFLIKGLVPGPSMLTTNLNVTYSMVWVIVLSNIIAVAVSFLFLKQLVRLTAVESALLVPFLLVLTAFGAYTAHNAFADILLMLAATAIGVAAIRWDWPRAPLLLALVLGDIAERYLFLSYSLYEWTWLSRPLVLVFAAVAVGGVLWPIVQDRRRRGRAARPQAPAGVTTGSPTRVVSMDNAFALVFLVAGFAVVVQASAWPFRSAVFPLAIGWGLFGTAALKLGLSFRPRGTSGVEKAPGAEALMNAAGADWRAAIGWMGAFFALLWLAGALVTVPLFALVYLTLVPRRSLVLAGTYALVSWGFVYGVFDRLLHVPLPPGRLLAALGALT
jgi:hypothetical protein